MSFLEQAESQLTFKKNKKCLRRKGKMKNKFHCTSPTKHKIRHRTEILHVFKKNSRDQAEIHI